MALNLLLQTDRRKSCHLDQRSGRKHDQQLIKGAIFTNRSNGVHKTLKSTNQSGVKENCPSMLKTPLNYIRLPHMLSSCLAIISTQIWHLAAPPACAGMRRRSQVNVLYYNYYSTPGQIEARAVLYSAQKRVRNSFHVPRFCLTIMRQGKKKNRNSILQQRFG